MLDRLNVVQRRHCGRSSHRCVGQVAIGGCVDFEDEQRDEHVHPEALHANKTTPMLTLVSAEAVQRVAESRNMKTLPDQNAFPIHVDDGGARAQDGGEGVVSHTDSSSGDWPVRDEGALVREHVIRGAGIRDD